MAYTLIATQTLTTATASVTFSSIPGTFKDLMIEMAESVSATADIYAQFNGDTGTNYSRTWLAGTGSAASSGRNSSVDRAYLFYNSTAMSASYAQIMSYSNTSVNKTILSRYGGADIATGAAVNLWRSTNAINQIVLATQSQTFSAGSTFRLWGVS